MSKAPELKLKEGDKAPEFTAPINGGGRIALADFKGKHVVLYFYPRDDTPGCTKEACAFRDHFTAFKKKGAVVLGVSVDSREGARQVCDEIQAAVHAGVGRRQENCRGLRRLGRENVHGPEIPGHVSRDIFDRAGWSHQKNLAASEAGGTR